MNHPWFAGHGYACIRVDMRGNGDSEGLMDDEYTMQELQDACDVIQWATEQIWCSGKVGMMGISWGGFNALQVASLRPSALKAIVTVCSTVDRFADDIHYKGGCLLGENAGWAANMLSYSSRPPDPSLVGDRWREMWLERLENMPFLARNWLEHQRRDDYWKHGSVCEDYGRIRAAVLSVGGWHDGYKNTISHLVSNLNSPVKGIVGPWIHKYPNYAGPSPRIGFLQECLRWWNKWLKDEDNGVEDLPAAPSAKRSLEIQVCSPPHCGSQTGDDELSFHMDSTPIAGALDIVGSPTLFFDCQVDKPKAQLIARLCDVMPDGRSTLITLGTLNLTHADSHESPQSLDNNTLINARITLDQIAYRLPAGHRLRLSLSTSYWPYLWPSPENTTVIIRELTLNIPQRTKIADSDECSFDPPETSAGWKHTVVRPASSSRDRYLNEHTGQHVTAVFNDFGENQDMDHGLITGSSVRETFTIHPDDPLSAAADFEWQQTLKRDD